MEAVADKEVVSTEKMETPDWYDLLQEAVVEPGRLAEAHRFFHKYSLVNKWLAANQLRALGLPLLPINTFGTKDKSSGEGKSGWLGAGRNVKKGEKASIALIMPVPVKGKRKNVDTGEDEQVVLFNRFILRRHWFHLDQTEGQDFASAEVKDPHFRIDSVLTELDIQEVSHDFSSVTDTSLGQATGRTYSVSPLEPNKIVGQLRQIARIVLGHTAAELGKGVPEDLGTQLIEAETVAYLCAATLGLTDESLKVSRQIIQDNLQGANRIPDKSAQRAFGAADKIINAGYC